MHDNYCEDCGQRPADWAQLMYHKKALYRRLCDTCKKKYWRNNYVVLPLQVMQK